MDVAACPAGSRLVDDVYFQRRIRSIFTTYYAFCYEFNFIFRANN